MKRFKLFFFALISLLILNSCSDDGPVNYENLRISRMDLSGAVSVGLNTGNSSTRAIDGEFASAGMYKIDANGNISAVGVYFTTDTKGNRLDHEESLRVAPKALFKLTDNYLLAVQCDYYDVEGDLVQNKYEIINDENIKLIEQEVPYKDLLVRISDGKIWCVDDISTYLYFHSYQSHSYSMSISDYYYNTDNRGNLYLRHFREKDKKGIYKFNLENDNYTFERIDKGDGFENRELYIYDGVVFTVSTSNSDPTLLWPNGGFQVIDQSLLNSIDSETLTSPWYSPSLIASVDGPRILYYNSEPYFYATEIVAKIANITFSDAPGSVGLGESISLKLDQFEIADNWRSSFYTNHSYYDDDEKILISFSAHLTDKKDPNTTTNRYYISIINKRTKQWNILRETDYYVGFDSEFNYDYDKGREYQGKIWKIIDDGNNFGAWWFDLNTFEIGFVNFNFVKPDYMRDQRNYISEGGYFEFSGVNPANGNTETVYIDITTGDEKWTEYEPERLLKYLIPLN